MSRFYLAIYRWAWNVLLPLVQLLARLDGPPGSPAGRGFIPRNWNVTERLGYGWPRAAAETSGQDDGSGIPGSTCGRKMPGKKLWLHCASLGEAKGLWAFARCLPESLAMVLTATTAEGTAFLQARCAEQGPESRFLAVLAPFDHPDIVRRFLASHDAVGLCLYEVELWPHFIAVCRERGLPVVLVSGRLSEKAVRRYRRFGGAGARLLDGLAWIQAQSPMDAQRFGSLTKTEIVTGFDFKAAHFLERGADARAEPAGISRFAFLSLHYRELVLLMPGLPALMNRSGVIIFPRKLREVERFHRLLEPQGFALHSRDPRARHLIVDAMGLIGALLPGCHSAFVGGSLIPIGCHNLWEPLLAETGIHFGPYFHAQQFLAERVLAAGIGRVLKDPAGIGFLPASGPEIPKACRHLVEELRQALDAALVEGGRRIFATFYSVQTLGGDAGANARRDGGKSLLAAGKDKGQ